MQFAVGICLCCVGCRLFFGVCCVLDVVCCLWFVVCGGFVFGVGLLLLFLLRVLCYAFSGVFVSVFAICSVFVVCCRVLVVCCMLFVDCCLLLVACCLLCGD